MLTHLFGYLKKVARNKKIKDIKYFIEKENKSLLKSLIEHAKKYKLNKFVEDGEEYLIAEYNPFYWISNFINNDKDLKNKFLKFDWEPHKFASILLASGFKVSVDTIESKLYRSGKKL